MKKNSKSGSVLLYVLFMLTIAVTLGLVVSNNSFIYSNNLESQAIIEKIHKNIYNKSDATIKLGKLYNSNGNGFIDDISCPKDVSMSGSTSSGTSIFTYLKEDSGNIYCAGSYLSDDFFIYFDKTYSSFISAIYKGSPVVLRDGIGEYKFSDSDNTLISFSTTGLGGIDGIDDNFNSDDYRITSTGTSSTGIIYPGNYADDDVDYRKKIYGYVEPYSDFYNIFYNNSTINEFINNNTNNDDNINVKLGDVDDGRMIFSFDGYLDIKLIKFDKILYETESLLYAKEIYNGTSLFGYGYLNLSSGSLFLNESISGDEFEFDFRNNDYGIFVKNNSSNYVGFNIFAETSSGTGIYINPVQDDGDDILYLGNDIYIDNDGKFIKDQFITKGFK